MIRREIGRFKNRDTKPSWGLLIRSVFVWKFGIDQNTGNFAGRAMPVKTSRYSLDFFSQAAPVRHPLARLCSPETVRGCLSGFARGSLGFPRCSQRRFGKLFAISRKIVWTPIGGVAGSADFFENYAPQIP